MRYTLPLCSDRSAETIMTHTNPMVIIPTATEIPAELPEITTSVSETDYIAIETELIDKVNESIALVGSGFRFQTSDEMYDENFELIDPNDDDAFTRYVYARITGGLTSYDEITAYLRSFMAQDYYEFYFRKYIKGGGGAVIAEHNGELYRDLNNARELSYRYDDPQQPNEIKENELYFDVTRCDYDDSKMEYTPTETDTLHAILEDGAWKIAF